MRPHGRVWKLEIRNVDSDGERREALRKFVMTCAAEGKIEFDALYERVVAHMP